MKFLKLLAMGAIASSVLVGCKTYDEGPGISFLPPEVRLDGEWQLIRTTSEFFEDADYTISFEMDDETYSTELNSNVGNTTITTNRNGTWLFTDDYETLLLTEEGEDDAERLEILELSSKNMTYRYDDEDYTFEKQ